jgi:hypothetical protein
MYEYSSLIRVGVLVRVFQEMDQPVAKVAYQSILVGMIEIMACNHMDCIPEVVRQAKDQIPGQGSSSF